MIRAPVDRVPENPDPSAGVNVLRGAGLLARIACQPSTANTPAFVLDDAMAAAGECWNLKPQPQRWQRGGCG